MKLSFRWYGPEDPIKIQYIRQIPNMYAIVTAVYDVPVGEIWSHASIAALKQETEDAGLHFDVIESVPVHEDIKLGLPTRDHYIANYIENIRRLGQAGIQVICYNFMPVFDWTRTQLDKVLPDGSTALVYYRDQLEKMDPLTGELSLPGWDSSYKKEDLVRLFDLYSKTGEEKLWENLAYFLKAIIPVAEEAGIKMAIHPDDPPYPIFGLPRIITNEANLDRLLKLVDRPANGLTLCTGSLGSAAFNDIPKLVDKYSAMGRIHFMHVRNVKLMPDGSFEESAHFSAYGSLDIVDIMSRLYKNNYDGYLRPDHGRMIWGETGKPGYGLYDRAMGASYLTGIWETLMKLETLERKKRDKQGGKHLKTILNKLPGIALTALIAIPAWLIGKAVPIIGGPVLGILFGMILAFWHRPEPLNAGIRYTSKKLLQYSIILLGFGMNLFDVFQVGQQTLILMAFTLTAAFATAFLAGKLLKLDGKTSTLIGVGSAICGGSAIAATAPVIDADDEQVAHAISTIFLFNVIAAFLFPFLGHVLGMSDQSFGLWAGTAVNDTSSVVAAGYAFSQTAGDLAVIVKLTRTLMIVPVTLVLAIYTSRQASEQKKRQYSLVKIFPWFVLGFLAASIINTFLALPIAVSDNLSQIGKFVIIMAMAAIGLNTNLIKLARSGAKPILLGLICWVMLAITSLVVQYILLKG